MSSSYGACKFWNGKRYCNKQGIWRDDYNQYYCTDHYQWHLKNREILNSAIEEELRRRGKQ